MKKTVFAIALILAITVNSFASRIVDELRAWDFSLGGISYLVEEDAFFYAIGTRRDLGGVFNWIAPERLYFELGYLNDIDTKQYGYIGVSVNANYVTQFTISRLNKILNANFRTPEFVDSILTRAGIVGAKSIESGFDFSRGYDYGATLSLVSTW